ncbi:hypothetical protein LTR37_020845 [Vermiconidia calcicola]|uniref:Uncharacterized protein n=1 Tax=Vermiconidia calcicola TaxID=1690605 RepID=A0ACC3MC08_9PEZI|nr:hypothetical protein LTR37_020845 [Vermiconidia calcicola]
MVVILDTLQRLETKFDNMSLASPGPSTFNRSSYLGSGTSSAQPTPPSSEPSSFRNLQAESVAPQQIKSYRERGCPLLTVPHRVLVWPRVYAELIGTETQAMPDLQAIAEGGTAWLVKQDMSNRVPGLPFNVRLSSSAHGFDSNHPTYSRVSFPSLTRERIKELASVYFRTINVLYPILDRGQFISDTVEPTLANGFGYGDASSVLLLLVLALGELAMEGIAGAPLAPGSGLRGGTLTKPPGLEFFNEARARIGSIPYQCDLVNVQVLLLQATYFGANACHIEYWRSTMAASMTCQLLAESPEVQEQWRSPQGDFIKRAFWTCVINEDLYHHDLDLPRTTIQEFEDVVPFPHFAKMYDPAESVETAALARIPQYHFLAKAALKRTITRIHHAIHTRKFARGRL